MSHPYLILMSNRTRFTSTESVSVCSRAALTFSAMLVLTSASGLTASGSDGTTTRADACTASARPKHKTIDKCFIRYAGIIPFHAADLPRYGQSPPTVAINP